MAVAHMVVVPISWATTWTIKEPLIEESKTLPMPKINHMQQSLNEKSHGARTANGEGERAEREDLDQWALPVP